ncbi:hypothetical protein RJ641_016275 [Dillenia turbinata]|uniref:Uncharacterized protein n=1 Tax=Dillenia turbinata TaxID=194707 RepID=A0AAN8Z0V8_9MAGN
MGMVLSAALGTVGVSLSPRRQLVNVLVEAIYKQYAENDGLADFENFHLAILDIYSTFNKVLGKHYDEPPLSDVKAKYDGWKGADHSKKQEIFVNFFEDIVEENRDHTTMVFTGVMIPPAAMVTKRALEKQPKLWALKHVPDIVFVPSATAMALISVKLSSRAMLGQHSS